MTPEELTPEVQQRIIDQYPAIRGWAPVGVTNVMSTPQPGPPAYPGGPASQSAPVDTGARTIQVSNPNGGPGSTNGVQITIERDSGGQGNWVVSKGPDDTKVPTGAANKPAAQVQADTDKAVADATKARADADKAIAAGGSDAALLVKQDAERQFNLENHGAFMTHAEWQTYSNNTDQNARAAAKATADTAQQAWSNTHADQATATAKRQQDIANHPPQQEKDPTTGNVVTKVWNTDTQAYSTPAGLSGTPADGKWMIGDKNSPTLQILDAQGNTISTSKNSTYVPPGPSELKSDTVAPFIHQLVTDANGNQTIQSVPNDNQLTVSQAMMEVLYPQLAKAMTSGSMSADTAKDLMTQASNQVKDQISAGTQATTAANDTLSQLNQGAQTGASLLNQRVKSTQDSLNSWIGAAGGNKNLGLGTQLGPGFGANLVNGIGDWATQMGGGQGVYDNAAAAVAAINPDDPHSAPSYATLSQMQARFKDLAGVPHPTEGPSTQTQFQTPQPQQAQPSVVATPDQGWVRADNTNTTGANVNPATGLAYPGMAGTVAPGSPNYMGFTAPTAPTAPTPFAQSDIREGTHR